MFSCVFSQRPPLRCAEQAGDDLRDEVALRLVGDQRLEHHRVGAAVGVEEQVRLVAVGDREVRGAGGLGHPVGQVAPDLRGSACDAGVGGQQGQEPAEGLEGQLLHARLAQQAARPRHVAVSHPRADVERVGDDRAPHLGAVLPRDVPLDVREVVARPVERLLRARRSPSPSPAAARAPRGC